MTRKFLFGMAMVLLVQSTASAQLMQPNARNGAVLGGVSGAVIGGIIGKQNNETPEGALIGGAVGAVAGGLIGNGVEQRQRAQQQQQWAQQQHYHHHPSNYNTYRTVPSRTTVVTAPGVTVADVLAMTRNGVGESVIINHIYSTGMQRRIDTNEIISLHQQGVPENVINAMQQAPLRNSFSGSTTVTGGQATTIMTPPGGTVIVQEQYGTPNYTAPTYTAPTYVQPRPAYYQSVPTRRGF